jgi:hypothetical protein
MRREDVGIKLNVVSLTLPYKPITPPQKVMHEIGPLRVYPKFF